VETKTIIDANGNEKLTKIPFIAGIDKEAKTNDPGTWKTFDEVIKAFQNNNAASGIGYVFSADDPFCFIDLDSCIKNGNINDDSKYIIDQLNSYTEISQSGNGIHIIIKALLPKGSGNRKDKFEIYTQGRFCAMTGNLLNGHNKKIAERQTEIDQICAEIFKKPKLKQTTKPTSQRKNNLSENEIIELCRKAANKDKFNKLFAGDTSDYPSASEADSALCWILAFYTRDVGQILNIVKMSGLYDIKWEREDYQNKTIKAALEGVTETYTIRQINLKTKNLI